MDFILSLIVGVSLSATSGFRLFIPLLFLSIASLAGWIDLAPGFAWIATYPALTALLIATVFEITAYLFPYVDNLIGLLAAPLSIIAGIMITAALVIDLDPMLAWTLAVILGGGAALGGMTMSNVLHAGATVTTGGVANPVLSLFETFLAAIMSIIAVLVPLLALLILIAIVILGTRFTRGRRRRVPA